MNILIRGWVHILPSTYIPHFPWGQVFLKLFFTKFSPINENGPIDCVEEDKKGRKEEKETPINVAHLRILPERVNSILFTPYPQALFPLGSCYSSLSFPPLMRRARKSRPQSMFTLYPLHTGPLSLCGHVFFNYSSLSFPPLMRMAQ